MGGSESVEFMVRERCRRGLDRVPAAACGYAGNIEKATSGNRPGGGRPGQAAPEKFPTPGVRTIDDLATSTGGARGRPTDQDPGLRRRWRDRAGAAAGRPRARRAEARRRARRERDGAPRPTRRSGRARRGRGQPRRRRGVGATDRRGFSRCDGGARHDHRVPTKTTTTCAASIIARDIAVASWLDLREVNAGEACPMCDAPLAVDKTIEIGHIFKLGTRYSEAFGATVLDENGKSQTHHHGLLRHRDRAHDGGRGRAPQRRVRHSVAAVGRAVRGGDHGRQAEGRRDQRRGQRALRRARRPRGSTCCSTIATSGRV